ncbi:response regulator [Subsaximicrobium wynnwilliamsii]|uniref:Response regulator n=1 Tax=Subsaximicrobium wynnwilliamsii TaxID=291179 RepID=A0A5C6ZN88_9FLAO|nr:response regulator [Subsaximicrobium wynnwilliamsii]TXD85577.1 response regulator [Subsaximicrobium wynnwilliamsii]TXD90930.1 response regulator [Subsaximicrobium wynnwilliamsii]TXE05437.1 response regulator [Subsaximicrobium wynnwilliamsii]
MIKILVVDDDRIIGEMLKFMLSSKGYLPVISNKPEQTIDNILQHDIDLVMLDQFIFGVSGAAICKELQETETTAHLPILMMSADTAVETKCLSAGATDFIAKPFEMKLLFSKIEAMLQQATG